MLPERTSPSSAPVKVGAGIVVGAIAVFVVLHWFIAFLALGVGYSVGRAQGWLKKDK